MSLEDLQMPPQLTEKVKMIQPLQVGEPVFGNDNIAQIII